MYNVVEISGHQYKVKAGDLIDVDKLTSEVNDTVDFDKVLFTSGDKAQVGKPTVNGAKVVAKVVMHDRARKQVVLTRKPGAYVKKNGHRTHFTSLLITEIHDGQGGVEKISSDNKYAKKYLK
ncbi:MAG: 50S ribosomal protein L21 [Halobacteriovoraceae bacterium]|nr:50S ribosomal protein L21 [Halobacteriovoraceae bacterium]